MYRTKRVKRTKKIRNICILLAAAIAAASVLGAWKFYRSDEKNEGGCVSAEDLRIQNRDTVKLPGTGEKFAYVGNETEFSTEPGIEVETDAGSKASAGEAETTGGDDLSDGAYDIFSSCYKEYSIDEKLALIRKRFPDGAYWNHACTSGDSMSPEEMYMSVSDIPCSHSEGIEYCNIYNGATAELFEFEDNCQCLGFASMVSDFLFGKEAPLDLSYDFDDLLIGDHIRLTEYDHSMIVTEKSENCIKVLECNENYEDCRISWDRILTRDDIYSYGDAVEIIKRY